MVALALAACLLASGSTARAERVHDATRVLLQGPRVKMRVDAAAELDRLRDRRAVAALVKALRDRSYLVREAVATALGHIGDASALPALERARADQRRSVRRKVVAAIELIRTRQRPASARSARTPARAAGGSGAYALALRGAPLDDRRQRIYVTLKSASDKSGDVATARVRQLRVHRMRSLMVGELQRSDDVTLVPPEALDASIDPYAIDLTVAKLGRVERGPNVEVVCEIRVAISTREGKMLSVLTGGAKVQVPKATFRDEFLPQLRGEALEGAVRSLHHDLVGYLTKLPRPGSQTPGSHLGVPEQHRRK